MAIDPASPNIATAGAPVNIAIQEIDIQSGPAGVTKGHALVTTSVSSSGGVGQEVQGVDATGEAPTGNPVLVAGIDGANSAVLPLQLDEAGNGGALFVKVLGGQSGIAINGDTNGNAYQRPALIATTPLTAFRINYNTTGDKTLVAAVSGQTTRVHRLQLSVAVANTLTIKTGTTVRMVYNLGANGSVTLDFASLPWYTTAANEALVLTVGSANQVDGNIEYVTSA